MNRQKQDIAHFIDARSAEARLRKTQQKGVFVLIATRVVPAIILVIGPWLNHPKGHGWPRKGMPRAVGANKRIDKLVVLLRLKRVP